jgi:hypothetical protein
MAQIKGMPTLFAVLKYLRACLTKSKINFKHQAGPAIIRCFHIMKFTLSSITVLLLLRSAAALPIPGTVLYTVFRVSFTEAFVDLNNIQPSHCVDDSSDCARIPSPTVIYFEVTLILI